MKSNIDINNSIKINENIYLYENFLINKTFKYCAQTYYFGELDHKNNPTIYLLNNKKYYRQYKNYNLNRIFRNIHSGFWDLEKNILRALKLERILNDE